MTKATSAPYLGLSDFPDDQLFFKTVKEAEIERDERRNRAKPPAGNWARRLTLGPEVFLSSQKTVKVLDDNETVSIDPGHFALMNTEEIISLPPDIVGFIALRTEFKMRGLVNISGFHVDPNYAGRLIFSVYNAGPNPVMVRRGQPLFMIVLSRVPPQADSPSKTFDRIPPDFADHVRGQPYSVAQIYERVQDLRTRVQVLTTVSIGLFVSIIVAVVVFLLNSGSPPNNPP